VGTAGSKQRGGRLRISKGGGRCLKIKSWDVADGVGPGSGGPQIIQATRPKGKEILALVSGKEGLEESMGGGAGGIKDEITPPEGEGNFKLTDRSNRAPWKGS